VNYIVDLSWIALAVALFWGWVGNIVYLVSHADSLVMGVKTMLMVIGVLFAPLGSLMYWFG
jgi:hypothetical protein